MKKLISTSDNNSSDNNTYEFNKGTASFLDYRDFKEFKSQNIQSNNKPTKISIPSNEQQLKSLTKINKTDFLDLECKYKQSVKCNEKLEKKVLETQEELKKLKAEREAHLKEINFLMSNLEKFKNDNRSFSKQLEDNKILIRKMESRLIQGAKNQSLLDMNHKLQEQIDGFNIKLSIKDNEISVLKSDLEKSSSEVKVLTKALELRLDQLKFPNNPKASILHDIGKIKTELEETKERNAALKQEIEKLQVDNEDKTGKITELAFAKSHLAEMLVDIESKYTQTIRETAEYKVNYSEIIKERDVLKELLDKIQIETKTVISQLKSDNKKLESALAANEKMISSLEESNTHSMLTINYLKENIASMESKIAELEENLSKNNLYIIELESNISKISNHNKILSNENMNFTNESKKFHEKIKGLLKQIEEVEKENLLLLSKNKELIFNQENNLNDIILENRRLALLEKKHQEIISNLTNDNNSLHQEKDKYKDLVNETMTKCSELIKEKEILEKEIENKNGQIEAMKLKNQAMTKKFSHSIDIKNLASDDEKDREKSKEKIQVDDEIKKDKDDTSLIYLIRKEKEKNKEFLEDIKKLKKSLIN